MIQILPEGRRVSPLRRLVVRSTRLHMHAPLVIALNVRDACDVAVQSATAHRAIHRDGVIDRGWRALRTLPSRAPPTRPHRFLVGCSAATDRAVRRFVRQWCAGRMRRRWRLG